MAGTRPAASPPPTHLLTVLARIALRIARDEVGAPPGQPGDAPTGGRP
ncbi:MAG TPA: hypothetical protein VGQ64_07895 [Candidatus Limnocylindrales bacterium]|nr:hypothetical protein [Candidatus Limnocylindrales bacterium]